MIIWIDVASKKTDDGREGELKEAATQLDEMSGLLHDQIGICTSFNWLNENVHDNEVFATTVFDRNDVTNEQFALEPNLKVADKYSDSGKYYHFFNTLLLLMSMDSFLVSSTVIGNYVRSRGGLKASIMEHGIGKIMGDLMVINRGDLVQKILFSFKKR